MILKSNPNFSMCAAYNTEEPLPKKYVYPHIALKKIV